MDIIELIDAYKAKHGIRSDNEFSRQAGISPGLLSKWRSGKCKPSTAKLEQVLKFIGADFREIILGDTVLASDLTDNRHLEPGYEYGNKGYSRFICVYPADKVNADTDLEHESPDKVFLPDRFDDPHEYFAMILADNNMAPELYSGDIVIVHRQNDADDGDTVVVCVGKGSAACAIIRHFDDGIVLHSPTREPGPAFFNRSAVGSLPVTILGKVVDIQHREYR